MDTYWRSFEDGIIFCFWVHLDAPSNLNIFEVRMAMDDEPDYVLEPIHERPQSESPVTAEVFFARRNMPQDNCEFAICFHFGK